MTRKFFLLVVLAGLIGAILFFYAGSRVPSGQPQLETLTSQNVSDIERAFNEAKGDIRVLMLLSPT
jgi:hypothetical protein